MGNLASRVEARVQATWLKGAVGSFIQDLYYFEKFRQCLARILSYFIHNRWPGRAIPFLKASQAEYFLIFLCRLDSIQHEPLKLMMHDHCTSKLAGPPA